MRIGAAESDDKLNAILKTMGVNECCTLVFTVTYNEIKYSHSYK